jgi:hypothetical protein
MCSIIKTFLGLLLFLINQVHIEKGIDHCWK